MLRKQVGRILLPSDLSQVDLARSDRLLDPEGMRIQMPQLAESLAGAYPDSCTGVTPHPDREYASQVGHQALEAESHARAADYTSELRLS